MCFIAALLHQDDLLIELATLTGEAQLESALAEVSRVESEKGVGRMSKFLSKLFRHRAQVRYYSSQKYCVLFVINIVFLFVRTLI